MRVIKEYNQERMRKCKNCKSTYAYTLREVRKLIYRTVICPVCKEVDFVSIFDKKVKEK